MNFYLFIQQFYSISELRSKWKLIVLKLIKKEFFFLSFSGGGGCTLLASPFIVFQIFYFSCSFKVFLSFRKIKMVLSLKCPESQSRTSRFYWGNLHCISHPSIFYNKWSAFIVFFSLKLFHDEMRVCEDKKFAFFSLKNTMLLFWLSFT